MELSVRRTVSPYSLLSTGENRFLASLCEWNVADASLGKNKKAHITI